MSEDKQNQPVEKSKSLAKTQSTSKMEQDITFIRLRLSRAQLLSIVAVCFAALAVLGGFFLWAQVAQLQKFVHAEGGIKDVSQIHSNLEQNKSQLSSVQARLDELVNIDQELGRVGNQLAALQGEYAELRRTTQERMKKTEEQTQSMVSEKLTSLESQLGQTETNLVKMQGSVGEIRDQVVAKLSAMEKSQTQFQDSAKKEMLLLDKEVSRTKTQRVLAEVEHYIRVAKQRITVEKEVRAAQNALEAAADRLLELDKRKIKGIYDALQKDIESLSVIEQADISGIANRIAELQIQIEQIPIKGMDKRFVIKPATNNEVSDNGIWDKALTTIKEGLKQVVHVRRISEPVMPLLAPKETFFLYQNLRLKLETARLALLKREQQIYQKSLEAAYQWVDKYLAPTSKAELVAASLQRMAKLNINPQLPELDRTLQVLREYKMIIIPIKEVGKP